MSPMVTATSLSSAGGGTSKYSVNSAKSTDLRRHNSIDQRRQNSRNNFSGRSERRRSSTQTTESSSEKDKIKKKRKARHGLSDGYEEPVSNREDWWRATMKETPVPGAYEHDDFLKEKEKGSVKLTYNFKNEGRKKDPHPFGRGEHLLPGAYQHKDFLQNLEKKQITYSFKGPGRSEKNLLILKDKDIDISPDKYSIEKHLSLTSEKQPSKHFFFRSQSQRFPSLHFKPREGPPPGAYTVMAPSSSISSISSSFKSKTPRFSSAHTKVPGPGAYEKTYQSPMPSTIANMGRQHGLFFACAFH